MLTRNKKLKDYGIPAEDIEKLNTMLKDFPAEYGYLLSGAALSACPKNTVIADMVIENILHRKSYRKISKEINVALAKTVYVETLSYSELNVTGTRKDAR